MDEEENLKTGTVGLKLKSESDVPDLTARVHLLPCFVKYDGPCAVSDYFKPKVTGVEVDGLKVEEAYFRGRKLEGATFPLPQGYCGLVLGKKIPQKRKTSDMTESWNSDCWELDAKFQSITYWNHDSLPSQHDTFLRSLHWLSVAEALHKPVTSEQLSGSSIHVEAAAARK
ncbi:hypothetical protein K2173_003990 [Erythroxylum novogranatense]|uniref:Uncharacterized protein n=1 Tax=Erythroxylum novogranatense TaxID=1862640 RepID=A0AAV8SK26_9ROSI|nr:hypothetical protein K2173_003990 [Erythroxylum novogranatense]